MKKKLLAMTMTAVMCLTTMEASAVFASAEEAEFFGEENIVTEENFGENSIQNDATKIADETQSVSDEKKTNYSYIFDVLDFEGYDYEIDEKGIKVSEIVNGSGFDVWVTYYGDDDFSPDIDELYAIYFTDKDTVVSPEGTCYKIYVEEYVRGSEERKIYEWNDTITKEGEYVIRVSYTTPDNVYFKGNEKEYFQIVRKPSNEVHEHIWSEWKTETPATCTGSGLEKRICTVCNESETRETAAIGHTWGEWKVIMPATCIAAGQESRACTVCGQTETRELAATGHTWSEWTIASAATVFAPEKQIRTCPVCKGTEERDNGTVLTPTISVNVPTNSAIPLKTQQTLSKLTVTGLANGDEIVSFKSNNTKVAKVSGNTKNGTFKITAQKKTGNAKITVTLKSGTKKVITVKVQKAAVKTKKITNVSKKATLKKGKKLTLKPILSPVTSKEKVTYKTSNKKVATVSSKGVITAKKKGTATITVKSGTVSYKCKVTVK